jgi:hypothetical protein
LVVAAIQTLGSHGFDRCEHLDWFHCGYVKT